MCAGKTLWPPFSGLFPRSPDIFQVWIQCCGLVWPLQPASQNISRYFADTSLATPQLTTPSHRVSKISMHPDLPPELQDWLKEKAYILYPHSPLCPPDFIPLPYQFHMLDSAQPCMFFSALTHSVHIQLRPKKKIHMYKSHCKNTKTWMSKPVSSIKPTRTVEIFTYENFINKLRIQNLKSQS